MIRANFSAYATYTTDSLTQWDLNQILKVPGLHLDTDPEVHFSNANTARAIVRQARTVNNVVTVDIPNSLLQEPLRICAHIGVYDGKAFKVVEVVEIPVKPRKRPEDYQIQDSDEEIYSFNSLENQLQNFSDQLSAMGERVDLLHRSGCVVFSSAYTNDSGASFIASSMVPLLNADKYSRIAIQGEVKIVGTSNTMGASRFTVSRYGAGFILYSADSTAVQTVAGKAVSFDFVLVE